MYYSNYILLRLQLFILSSFFLFLFFLIFTLSFKSLDFIILCDGETIEGLKESIISDIVKYEELTKEFEDLEKKAKELSSLVHNNYSYMKADTAWDEVFNKLDEAAEVYARIFTI